MNCPNERFKWEEARPEDSAEILAVLEEYESGGKVSFVSTRRPDPIASLSREGEKVIILVCRDFKKQAIAMMGILAIRKAYVGGAVTKVGYLFGLRIRTPYKRFSSLLPRGFRLAGEYARQLNVQCVYTTILDGNEPAKKLFEKKRRFMPGYNFMGTYEVYNIGVPHASRIGRSSHDLIARRCRDEDMDEVFELIADFARTRVFYPFIDARKLSACGYPGLSAEHFIGVWDRMGRIVACGALWDQKEFKQFYAKKYGKLFETLSRLPFVMKLVGYPALSKKGERMRFANLSFCAVRNADPACLYALIGEAARQSRDLSFLAIGMHERDPLSAALQKVRSIRYRSRVYLVDWTGKMDSAKYADAGVPYLDIGLL